MNVISVMTVITRSGRGSLSLVPNKADDPNPRHTVADTVIQLLLLHVTKRFAAIYAMAAVQSRPPAMQHMQVAPDL